MKILRAEVIKLNGRYNYGVDFHSDINIITGVNGSGKSTFIKLMWYMISGNLERIPFEIEVSSAKIITDHYTISIELSGNNDKSNPIRGMYFNIYFKSKKYERNITTPILRNTVNGEVEEINRMVAEYSGSLFFPTYRRVEWGSATRENRRLSGRQGYYDEDSALEVIGTTLDRVSKEVSVANHKFVTSASLDDIIALLTEKYANISRGTNLIQNKLSEMIISQIEAFDDGGEKNSSDIMSLIKREIERANGARDKMMMPFSKFTELATKVIGNKKVRMTRFLTIGAEGANEVPPYLLSAGEKQMISFLCYNALYDNFPFIIDEPELSLHTDWQRVLFPLMISQNTNNQFIAVTHSPFVYSKYSDKEIVFNRDRGNMEDPPQSLFKYLEKDENLNE